MLAQNRNGRGELTGIFLGFGLFGIARLAYDGAATPIVVTSDPPFFLLILGIVMVIISINGALGLVHISHNLSRDSCLHFCVG